MIYVMFPNQSSLVGSRVGHSVPPISRTIHVGFRNMLSSGFGFATSDAPLWLGVLGIQWVFANNPLMFSAGFVTRHLLFRVDCVGNLVRTPHKKKPGHCKPGSRIAFQLLHTYIYIYIHTYTHVCMYMHKPRYPCCDLQKEHIRRWFSLVSKRFGIQELGAPKPCPPYPYTVKIVEAGPVPLDAVCRRK